jgi:CRP/FNR family cyclic AMP-dependent transcriptional regulator
MLRDKLWFLENIKFFVNLSPEDRSYVTHITEEVKPGKFNLIFLPGDRAKNIYIIKMGRVKLSKILENGKQVTLAILKPGDIFGEAALLGIESQDMIAEAMENSYLCYISKEDFENLMKKQPELSLKITRLIGKRLKSIETRIENLVFRDCSHRLAGLLIELSKSEGKETEIGLEIDLRLTHEDISELIAVNRQTVTEKLNDLKRQGLIDLKRAKIIITDINGLKNIIQHNPNTDKYSKELITSL